MTRLPEIARKISAIFLCLLFPAGVLGAEITLELEGELDSGFSIKNVGSASAYNIEVNFQIGSQPEDPTLKNSENRLGPGQNFSFRLPLPAQSLNGRELIPIWLRYKDSNGKPYSTVHLRAREKNWKKQVGLHFRAYPAEILFPDQQESLLEIQNVSTSKLSFEDFLVLSPEEFSATHPSVTEIPAGAATRLKINFQNNSALDGSIYSIPVIARYRLGGSSISQEFLFTVKLKPTRPRAYLGFVGALVLASIYFAFCSARLWLSPD